jgi:hypothetical protein
MFDRQLCLTHGTYFSGIKKKSDIKDVREKPMAENQARLLDAFRDMHIKRGLPMEDFELAHRIVYGGAHTVTKPDQKSKDKEQNASQPDPTYERDEEEMNTADDDIGTDEEEHNVHKQKTKVLILLYLVIFITS